MNDWNEHLDGETIDQARDGIDVADGSLPNWWKWIYAATILFAPFYWMYYHIGAPGRSSIDAYDVALATNTRLQFAEIGDLKPDAETIVRYMHKGSWVKVGQSVFKANCVSCHGQEGEGKIGPNLTDEVYKNVNRIEDIARVINEGAAAGAMPKWSDRLHPNEVVLLSAYVASLRGKDVAGRAPEGKTVPLWPVPSPDEDAGNAEDSDAKTE